MAIKIFCCYAREDEALLSRLRTQLVPLQREGLIEVWYDGEISAGTHWETELHKQLDTAQVILLLISRHFIASDYCYGVEMRKAMQRHERGEACVIPIILSPVHWQETPFGKLQALPKNAKPLTTWWKRDEAFFNVVDGIRESIKKLDISTRPVAVTSTIGSGIGGFRIEDLDAVDPDQMLKQAQRLIQEDPSPHGYSLAGTVLAAAGLHRKAVGYLLRSVQEDEDQPSTWFNLGQAYELIGETEKASEALIRALRLRRDFSRILKQRDNELPKRVKEYLSGIEERYRSLLEQRSRLMEKAIVDLKGSTVKSESALITITKYEVARGTNLSQFIIHLEPDGTAITFCYPEELRDAEILMPFLIPKGVDFEKQKSRFMDHFGYKEFEFNEESDESPKSMMFFAGQLKYEKLSAEYLLRWILRSVLFQKAGEAFFENRPYWEVQIDEGKALDSSA